MPDLIQVRYGGKVPGTAGLNQRAFNDIKRQAWEQVGEHWFTHMAKKHFTAEGAREYGYAPRAGQPGNTRPKFWSSYTGRKQREQHHTLPLVYTGELRQQTLASVRVVATATANKSGVRVILRGARKANLRHKDSQINMRDELTRVSPAESEELVRMYDELIERALNDRA